MFTVSSGLVCIPDPSDPNHDVVVYAVKKSSMGISIDNSPLLAPSMEAGA